MRLKISLVVAVALGLNACRSDDQPQSRAPAQADSAAGEVVQYALMKNHIGWLTDSNVVALATQVNSDAQGIARLESQSWSREPLRLFAADMLRDHLRLQYSIDSVATLRRLPSQAPAVAPELKAPYDSLLATQVGLSVEERERQFVDRINQVHARSMVDFGALGGNATDPDLRMVLLSKAVEMEQAHIARARMFALAIAKADSARADSIEAKRRGRP